MVMVRHGVLAPGWHHFLLGVVPASPNVRIGIPDGVDNIFKTVILCMLPCGVADLKLEIYRVLGETCGTKFTRGLNTKGREIFLPALG